MATNQKQIMTQIAEFLDNVNVCIVLSGMLAIQFVFSSNHGTAYNIL